MLYKNEIIFDTLRKRKYFTNNSKMKFLLIQHKKEIFLQHNNEITFVFGKERNYLWYILKKKLILIQ